MPHKDYYESSDFVQTLCYGRVFPETNDPFSDNSLCRCWGLGIFLF
ncbi:hypothetical protein PL11201_80377 [Planktothrix sp. PCC 11201]|nr:hypothetical protein PL11201_80377 [Planktothrix sp. PCC 11201]